MGAGIFLILLASGAVLLYNFYPRDRALSLLTSGAQGLLKRRVRVKSLDYSLRGIVLDDVRIYDGLTEDSGILASADEAVIRFSLARLVLRGKFHITFVKLDGLNLNIVYTDGVSTIHRLVADLSGGEKGASSPTPVDAIVLSDARVTLRNPPKNLAPLEGSYILNGAIEFRGDGGVYISDCKIILPEKRGVVYPEVTVAARDGDFSIEGDATLDRCSLPWVYTWGKNLTLPYMDVSGRVRDLRISSGAVEGSLKGSSTLNSGKQLLVDGFCRVSITEGKVFLSGIQASIENSSFLIEEFLFGFGGDIRKFRIVNIRASVPDLLPVLKFLPAQIDGTANGSLSMDGGRYTGTLTVNLGLDAKKGFIKNAAGTIVIKNNVIDGATLSMLLYGQPAEIFMASTDGNLSKINVNARLKAFSYAPQAEGDAGAPFKPVSLPVEVRGTIEVAQLQIASLPFTQAVIQYHLAGGRLSVPAVSAQFLGAEVKARGGADLSRETPRVDLAISFGNLKVQNLGSISERLKNRFFGTAHGGGDFGFTIMEGQGLSRSLRGRIEFTVDRGKLVNTGIQDGLGVWLEDLKYKLRDLEFTKIYGNFSVAGNTFTINSFLFNAQDVRLKMDGHATSTFEGDIRIDLEFTQRFIQDLPNPVFIQLGKYKRDRWYVIPFRARGKDITDSKNITRLD